MQKKIKILHIQETMGSGGVERRRLSLAKHLDKNLFDQKFVCTFAKGNIPEEIPDRADLQSVRRLRLSRFTIRSQNPDICKIYDV